MEPLKGLTTRLKVLRAERGYSQDEVARMLELSLTGYAKIERGETKLTVDRCIQIAELYGLTCSDLMNGTGMSLSGGGYAYHTASTTPSTVQESGETGSRTSALLEDKVRLLEALLEEKERVIRLMEQQLAVTRPAH